MSGTSMKLGRGFLIALVTAAVLFASENGAMGSEDGKGGKGVNERVSEDRKDVPKGMYRKPGQTDEEWETEIDDLLNAIQEWRRENPPIIETHAKRTSWKTKPFGVTVEISYADRFSPEEFEKLKRGLIPAAMEDKWFIYFEAGQLFLHRSWTGNAVYKVKLKETEDGGAEVLAAHYATEYREASELEYGVALLRFLIGNLILDRGLPFPMPAGVKNTNPGAFQHLMTGSGYPEKPLEEK